MPTYEYQCKSCGHEFEVRQSMKDPHLTDCPQSECAGPIKRKIGLGAGFIFKGSGFYITDYRSDAYKAAAKKDSEGGGSGAAAAASTTSGAGTASGGSSSASGASSSGGGSSGAAAASSTAS